MPRSLVVAGLLVVVAVTALSATAPAQPEPYAQDVRPLLTRYCLDCHNAKTTRGGLDLARRQGHEGPAAWVSVWERLRSGQMPPAGQPQPTGPERARLLAWIEQRFADHTLDGQPDPGPLRPRRLNAREHMNSFRDLATARDTARPRRVSFTAKPDGSLSLYGILPPPEHPCAFVPRLLPQDTADGGFDTLGENLSVPPFLVEKHLRCAKVLLDDLFTLNAGRGNSYQWPLYQSLTTLQKGPPPRGLTQRQAVTAFLKNFASRAFRRPVTAEEIARYDKLFDQTPGADFEQAIRLPLQAILASPRFVLLWSDAPAPTDKQRVRPLDDHELATRLALFLWSSVPDRELTQLAEQGKLREPVVLEQQVRRMLHADRVREGLLHGFFAQWLQLDRLDRTAPDAEKYPGYFRDNLAELMKTEVVLFIEAMLGEDRSILEFLDAEWGILCQPLAEHYGIANFPGKKPGSNAAPPWYRVTLPDRRRGGVLTMGKVLTGTSQPVRTSPVQRGKWILETILGITPPPPPPEVDNVLKEERGNERLTVPQLLARHRDNPACASCHNLIDPLGLAFENFDPVGRWRERDQDQPVAARGALADGTKFDGIVELKTLLLARKEEFVRGFVERMLAYALGRKLEFYDAATVRQIVTAVTRDDYKLSRVVVEVARSYPFLQRRVNEGNKP